MTKKIAWEQHRDNINNVSHTNSQKTVNNGQTVTRDALGRVITLDQPRTDWVEQEIFCKLAKSSW